MKNKTKKKRNRTGWIMVVLVTLAILLTGCQGQQERKQKTVNVETAQRISFPESYQYSGEQVEMNIEKIEPQEAYFINGTAKSIELDCIEIGRMFMPDDGTNDINMEQKCILSKEMLGDAHKEIFLWGENSFSYQSNEILKFADSLGETEYHWNYNLPLFSEKKEFSFGSAEDALEEIMKFLEEAGIRLGDDYKVDIFYLDYETLREEETYYDMDGNIIDVESKWEWSEADNAYLFYIHQSYCGLEDYHYGKMRKPSAKVYNAQIKVIYNANGIAEIQVQNLSTYFMGSKQEKLLDFETIAQKVCMHYDYILGNNSYDITSAKLICDFEIPDSNGESKIIPVWEFQITEDTEGGIQMHYERRFNAITGEILIN